MQVICDNEVLSIIHAAGTIKMKKCHPKLTYSEVPNIRAGTSIHFLFFAYLTYAYLVLPFYLFGGCVAALTKLKSIQSINSA